MLQAPQAATGPGKAHRRVNIREALRERPIILVALTGYADSADRLRAREAGFDAHLPKPINADKLNSLLKGTEGFKLQEIEN